jgi:hypothetical protein
MTKREMPKSNSSGIGSGRWAADVCSPHFGDFVKTLRFSVSVSDSDYQSAATATYSNGQVM